MACLGHSGLGYLMVPERVGEVDSVWVLKIKVLIIDLFLKK